MKWRLALVLLMTGCGGADDRGGDWPPPDHAAVERLATARATDHWPSHGFAELVPPVRLPTTHDHRDRIQVWIRLPDGGRIRTRWLDEQARHTITFPPGTRIDRVESLRYSTGAGQAWTVADVRGATLEAGSSTVHVLRPVGGEPQVPLVGYAWPAGHDAARRHATELLLGRLRVTPVPIRRPPMDRRALARFARFNRCGHCHRANVPVTREDRGDRPKRATDESGCFVPLAVLRSAAPTSEARPNDLNAEDPYVALRCADGTTPREVDGAPTCGDDAVPAAWRDVARGMADGDRYTERVCASRRYLYRHLDARGREAFAEGFEDCGIP